LGGEDVELCEVHEGAEMAVGSWGELRSRVETGAEGRRYGEVEVIREWARSVTSTVTDFETRMMSIAFHLPW
jgi:hypothetical protein